MPSRPVSPIERYGYELTIYRRADGNYAAELLSSEGDMWSDLYQARQEGEQFKEPLIAFAEAFGIPWTIKPAQPAGT
jgi:hypothetical protein